MRRKLIYALALFVGLSPLHAAEVSGGPELAIRFFNTIPDICFDTARGNPPTNENAASRLLEPAVEVPPTVALHFNKVTSWFRLKSQPDNIYVGVGDRPNACHIVLTNTKQTVEVQAKVIGFLKIGGFQTLNANAPTDPLIDMLFVKKAPDGYMLVSLQAPRGPLRNGEGDQGAVHVNLMPAAMFEAMVGKR